MKTAASVLVLLAAAAILTCCGKTKSVLAGIPDAEGLLNNDADVTFAEERLSDDLYQDVPQECLSLPRCEDGVMGRGCPEGCAIVTLRCCAWDTPPQVSPTYGAFCECSEVHDVPDAEDATDAVNTADVVRCTIEDTSLDWGQCPEPPPFFPGVPLQEFAAFPPLDTALLLPGEPVTYWEERQMHAWSGEFTVIRSSGAKCSLSAGRWADPGLT